MGDISILFVPRKNMTGMGYTTTLDVLSHSLHTYIEHCMKTENVEYQMMRNDRDREIDWKSSWHVTR